MEIKVDMLFNDPYKQVWKVINTGAVELTTGAVKHYVTLHNLGDNQLRTITEDFMLKHWSVVSYRQADEAPMDTERTIKHLMNNAEYQWNDKDFVCLAFYGHEDKPENVTSILKQCNVKKKDVTRLKKIGVVHEFFVDDMAVIVKMHYSRVLNATDFTEEYLANLG
jgi:hypothetical protein